MYRCQICKHQSEKGEPQFSLVTKRRVPENGKGWEIVKEKKVCVTCYLKKKE